MTAASQVAPASEVAPPSLEALAAEINARHQAAYDATKTAFDRWVECGELLVAAKEKVGHGNWGKWIKANLSFDWNQACKYMALIKRKEELANLSSGINLTSLNQALALLAAPVAEEEPAKASSKRGRARTPPPGGPRKPLKSTSNPIVVGDKAPPREEKAKSKPDTPPGKRHIGNYLHDDGSQAKEKPIEIKDQFDAIVQANAMWPHHLVEQVVREIREERLDKANLGKLKDNIKDLRGKVERLYEVLYPDNGSTVTPRSGASETDARDG